MARNGKATISIPNKCRWERAVDKEKDRVRQIKFLIGISPIETYNAKMQEAFNKALWALDYLEKIEVENAQRNKEY